MPKTPLAVMTSDWHLAKCAWTRHPDLCGDSYYSLSQIVDYCVNHRLPLLGAGDLLDSASPSSLTMRKLNEALERMWQADLRVYITQGQHERDPDPWLCVFGKPTHMHGELVAIGGMYWYGLDYQPAHAAKEQLAAIPKTADILMCHQAWLDLLGERAKTECAFADVAHVRYILTGDYHTHTALHKFGLDGQRMQIWVPGSMCQQAVDEPFEKFFYVLYDDMNVESIKLKTREFNSVAISNAAQLDLFVADMCAYEPDKYFNSTLPEEIRKSAVWVRYNAALPKAYERITAAVGNRAHLFVTCIREEAETQNVSVEQRHSASGGLVNHLSLVCKPGSKIYVDAKRLLLAQDPTKELTVMRQEALGCD